MNTPRTWVRAGLVGVLSLLGLVASLSEARSQFPRPPISQPPRPPLLPPRPTIPLPPTPGFSGIGGGITGIGGMPGGITGISGMPGGITGISGMPGGITGIGGGIGGFTMTETVWKCSGCNAVLGRGPVKPNYSSCPQCQARFRNGGVGAGGFTMISPPAPTLPFTTPPAPAVTPPADPAPEFTLPGFTSPPPAPTPVAGPAAPDTTGSTGMKWKVVGLVVVALAIIAATGGALVWNANRSREFHRRSRYVD